MGRRLSRLLGAFGTPEALAAEGSPFLTERQTPIGPELEAIDVRADMPAPDLVQYLIPKRKKAGKTKEDPSTGWFATDEDEEEAYRQVEKNQDSALWQQAY